MQTKKLLTAIEAGRLLGISGAGVRYLIRIKRLPAVEVAGKWCREWRIDPDDLGRMDRRNRGPVPKTSRKYL